MPNRPQRDFDHTPTFRLSLYDGIEIHVRGIKTRNVPSCNPLFRRVSREIFEKSGVFKKLRPVLGEVEISPGFG